jgi:hypothetical protein
MARQQVESLGSADGNRNRSPKYLRTACGEAYLRMDHLRKVSESDEYGYHFGTGAEPPAPGLLRRAVTRLRRGARDVVQRQGQFFGPVGGASKRRVALLGLLTGGAGGMAALLLFGWSDFRPGFAKATEPLSVYPSAETTASRVIDIGAKEMFRQEAIRRRGLEMLRADFPDPPPLPRGKRLELPAQAADLAAMPLAIASASGATPAAAPSLAPARPQQSSPLEAVPLIQPGDEKAGDTKPRYTNTGPGPDQRTAAFRAALAAQDRQEKPEKAVVKYRSGRSEGSERAFRHHRHHWRHAWRDRRHDHSREARAEPVEISREQPPAAATTQQSELGQSYDWVKRMQDAVAPSSLKSGWDNLWRTKPAATGG